MLKKILFVLTFVFLINQVYSETQISQISFINTEFIEFKTNFSFNFSSIIFFDEAGINKSNKLTLIKNNSNFNYLIVGNNFLKIYNLSNLNYSIFKTNKSGLGYRGLKNSGENITIYFNSTKNLTWIKKEDLSFKENQTLQFNNVINKFEIKNITFNYFNFSNNKIKFNNISKKNFSFKIITPKEIFINEKIKFSFETNLSNYTIEYFIEDYFQNIFKLKRNTTNLNQKSFTPKKESKLYLIKVNLYQNEIYLSSFKKQINYIYNPKQINSNTCEFEILTVSDFFENKIKFKFSTNQNNFTINYSIKNNNKIVKNSKITTSLNQKTYTPKSLKSNKYEIFATLFSNSCNLTKTKEVIYYVEYIKNSSIIQSNLSKSQLINKDSTKFYPKIQILNKLELTSSKTNELKLKLNRFNERKRVYYLYLNNNKLSSYELEKFTSITIKENLNLIEGKNNITIFGINETKELIILKNISILKNKNKNKIKNIFSINNFIQNSSIIQFNISTNLNLSNLSCYINLQKTTISSFFNLKSQKDLSKITLIINNSLIFKKSNNNTNKLKLICRYKKISNKNFKYSSTYFNYTLNKKILQILINSSPIESLSTLNYPFSTKNLISNITIPKINMNKLNSDNNKDEIKTNFEDKSQIQKENSLFFILFGTILITSILILNW